MHAKTSRTRLRAAAWKADAWRRSAGVYVIIDL